MTTSAFALVGYIGWTLVLLITMEAMRTTLVLGGRRTGGDFKVDGSDVSPFAQRLARAHANCYESFPIIGGLLLLALVTGHTSVTDPLALWLLAARVAQSSAHLVSTHRMVVRVRFSFFAVQMIIAAWWAVQFLVQW
jgi:uncharacterized MAPEG superfamily protein